MYEAKIHKLACTLSASEFEITHAKVDVLAQLYATCLSRVAEQRAMRNLAPDGNVMIKVTVEQWCTEEETNA